jgi:uncharacterized protein (TIGR03435 family)
MTTHARISFVLGLALISVPRFAAAQPRPPVAFEVASIKPSPAMTTLNPQALMSGQIKLGLNVTASRVDIDMTPLNELIRMAYGVKSYQVTGPDWMASERFDITAKLPEGATKDDVNEALKALLVERFGLAVHTEKKERPIYALVVTKDGPKMKPGLSDSAMPKNDEPPVFSANGASLNGLTQGRDGTVNATVNSATAGTAKITMSAATGYHIEALNITMPALADQITAMMERPVIDQTGLTGTYQASIDIPMSQVMAMAQRAMAQMGLAMPALPPGAPGGPPAAGAAAEPDGGTSVAESLSKLGLQLEKKNAPVDVIVVDTLEKTPKED